MRYLIFLYFLLCFELAHAGDVSCEHKSSNLGDLSEVSQALGFGFGSKWFAATKKQVLKAPCKTQRPPSEQEMLQYLESKKSRSLPTLTSNGVNFKDEDLTLVQTFRDMHLKRDLQVDPSCRKVLCAMEQIYGRKEGIQLLYLLSRYGLNGSYMHTEGTIPWKADQLDDALMMLSDWPESVVPKKYNTRFIHMDGVSPNDPREIANSTVAVFQMWDDLSGPERQLALYHEMGHNVVQRGEEFDLAWLSLSDWRKKGSLNDFEAEWKMGNPQAAVSRYGEKNPMEDFAESVTAYRYNGANFKKNSPDKYDFIKEHIFKGFEFDTEANCRRGPDR